MITIAYLYGIFMGMALMASLMFTFGGKKK